MLYFSENSFYPMETTHSLAVGEAVFYAREQAVGIIYETYTYVDGPQARPGVGLLLSNGHNAGGFNAQEADQFLMPLEWYGPRLPIYQRGAACHRLPARAFR